MARIGITGGIASGKSTFRELLAGFLPAVSFDADTCARDLLREDPTVRERVVKEVHPGAYLPDGTPDRALLREVIYAEPAKKRALEDILHPLVRERWLSLAKSDAPGFLLVDIPLLFETGAESHFDRVVTVACPVSTQRERVMARNALDVALIERIISSQSPLEQKISRSHHVVWNDGPLDLLADQARILCRYLHDRYG